MEGRFLRIEVELLSPDGSTCRDVANSISGFSSGREIKVCLTYSKAISGRIAENWQLVPKKQSAITPSADDNGNKQYKGFKLLSPRIKENEDILNCAALLKGVGNTTSGIKVSQNAGMRVRIGVKGLISEDLVKLCQNFVKYEDAIDALVPPSRRTGSAVCDRLFRSNKLAMGGPGTTNKQRHDAIAACTDVKSLVKLMNPEKGRIYKLYLRDLDNAVHPTIQFSQHSSTVSGKKMRSWIKLCTAMVNNSAKNRAPRALLQYRTLDEQFDALFQHVVKNEDLHQFYVERRTELSTKRKQQPATASSRKASRTGNRKVAAKKKSSSMAECGCCLEKFVKDEMCSCQERGHLFCRTCIRKYAAEDLYSNEKSELCCISTDGCKSAFNTRQLERALPQKMIEKLREMQYLSDMKKAGQVECDCPKCGCRGFIPKEEKTFSCPKVGCLHKSCRLCHEPAHEPVECSAVARTHVEESMSAARLKRCPHCMGQYIAERGGGCTYVKCTNCGRQSCFVCGSLGYGSCRCMHPLEMTNRAAVKSAGNNAVDRMAQTANARGLDGIVDRLI